MDELREILREHAGRYPLMQPTDAVKLVYQNEFGGGHLIKDEASCLQYLRRDFASVAQTADVPLYEPIGNGLCRVNLASLDAQDLEELGRHFVRSAAAHRGTLERFRAKLFVLEELVGCDVFSFDSTELAAYLAAYEKLGWPAVSHSEAYHPAYRVVKIEVPDGETSI